MIGRGHEDQGLYLMDDCLHVASLARQICSSASITSTKTQLLQWHYHLGHISFFLLCPLFPTLCCVVSVSDFY